jgi:ATP:ADP antiporter, AAA family
MRNYLKQFFRFDADEGTRILILLLWGFFTGSALVFYAIGSISLFFQNYTEQSLFFVFFVSGIFGMIGTAVFTEMQSRIPFSSLAYSTIAFCGLNLLLIFFGLKTPYVKEVIFYAFMALPSTFAILLLCFRGMADRIFDVRQSKRFISRADWGLFVSAFAVSVLMFASKGKFVASSDIYILWSGLILFTGFFVMIVIFYKYDDFRHLDNSDQYVSYYNSFSKLIQQKYIVYLGLFSFFSTLASAYVAYNFIYIISLKFPNGHHNLIYYFGMFGTVVFAAQFIFKTFFSKAIINKYGLKIATGIVPVLIFIFVLLSYIIGKVSGFDPASDIFFLIFLVVTAGKVVACLFGSSLGQPAFASYFYPIEKELRFDIYTKINGFVSQFSIAFAGLSIFLVNKFYEPDIIDLYVLAFLALAGWFFMALLTSGLYKERLQNTLEDQQVLIKKDSKSLNFAEELYNGLPFFKGSKLLRSLNILNTLDPVLYKKAITGLLDSHDDYAQKIALHETGKLCLLDAIDILEKYMASKYFHSSSNSELIKNIYYRLKGAEFRLKKLKYIEQLTFSKRTNERQFGACLTAFADNAIKSKLFNNLFRDTNKEVRYQAVASAAGTTNKDIYTNLVEMLDTSLYSNAAVAAMSATGEELLPILETAFYSTGQKEKIQLRIIEAYGKIGTAKAVIILSKKLAYPNQNISKAVLKALSRSGYNIDKDSTLQVKRELDEVCTVLVWNMSVYLDLERLASSELLMSAVKSEIDNNYNDIYKLLALLYDSRSVELINKNINSTSADDSEFASGLLDIILAEEMKPMLLPLLNPSSYDEKVMKMQGFLPTEPMEKHDLLYSLIFRDYKWVNRWTKACSIKELAEEKNPLHTEVFAANMVNPDPLLKEIATKALYDLGNETLSPFLLRFKDKYEFPQILLNGANHDEDNELMYEEPRLIFDIAKFLSTIEGFSDVPGIILSEVAKILKVKSASANEVIGDYESGNCMDYFIVYDGDAKCLAGQGEVKIFKAKQLISNLEVNNFSNKNIEIKVLSDCLYYKIPREQFNELIAFYDEIPKSLLLSEVKAKKEIFVNTF